MSEDTLAVGSGVLETISIGVEASEVALGVTSGVDSGVLETTPEGVIAISVGLGVVSGVVSGVLEATSVDDWIEELVGADSGVVAVTSVTNELTETSVVDVLAGTSLSTIGVLICETVLELDSWAISLEGTGVDSAAGVVEETDTTLLAEETEAETVEEVTDSIPEEEDCGTTTALELVVAITELDDETDAVLQSTATMETSSISKYGPSDGLLSTRNWRVCVPFDTVYGVDSVLPTLTHFLSPLTGTTFPSSTPSR
jgi:hypothetical protein